MPKKIDIWKYLATTPQAVSDITRMSVVGPVPGVDDAMVKSLCQLILAELFGRFPPKGPTKNKLKVKINRPGSTTTTPSSGAG